MATSTGKKIRNVLAAILLIILTFIGSWFLFGKFPHLIGKHEQRGVMLRSDSLYVDSLQKSVNYWKKWHDWAKDGWNKADDRADILARKLDSTQKALLDCQSGKHQAPAKTTKPKTVKKSTGVKKSGDKPKTVQKKKLPKPTDKKTKVQKDNGDNDLPATGEIGTTKTNNVKNTDASKTDKDSTESFKAKQDKSKKSSKHGTFTMTKYGISKSRTTYSNYGVVQKNN